jgi:autophagy-related protein 18
MDELEGHPSTSYRSFKKEPFLFFGFIIGSGGIAIAEMLFCTSLIALVGAGEHPSFSPRKLQIVNTKVSM